MSVVRTTILAACEEFMLLEGDFATGGSGSPAPKSITVENPVGASEIIGWFFTDVELTVSQLNFVVTGIPGAQLDVSIHFGPTRNAVGTEVIVGGTTVTNMAAGQEVTVFSNSVIPADSWVQYRSNSPINAPDEVAVTMKFV